MADSIFEHLDLVCTSCSLGIVSEKHRHKRYIISVYHHYDNAVTKRQIIMLKQLHNDTLHKTWSLCWTSTFHLGNFSQGKKLSNDQELTQ